MKQSKSAVPPGSKTPKNSAKKGSKKDSGGGGKGGTKSTPTPSTFIIDSATPFAVTNSAGLGGIV